MDKTYGGTLCSMDLALVFHPPSPGGRIQATNLCHLERNLPGGRACACLFEKVRVIALDHPPRAAYYGQTVGDSVRAPGSTVHFRELL
jgi:hypothetical protein